MNEVVRTGDAVLRNDLRHTSETKQNMRFGSDQPLSSIAMKLHLDGKTVATNFSEALGPSPKAVKADRGMYVTVQVCQLRAQVVN